MNLRTLGPIVLVMAVSPIVAGRVRIPDRLLAAGQGNAAGPEVRLAVNMTTIESAPVFVAAEGPSGAVIRLSSGGIAQLVSNSADAATNASTQAVLRSVANPNLRIILTVAECYYRIVARRSAGIQRIADLRGKKVATSTNTSAHFYLVKMLRTASLAESDVTVVPLQLNEMPAALKKGDVDAVSIWEPGAQNSLEAVGEDVVVLQDRSVYRELFNLNTTTDVLTDRAKRPALINVVRAIVRASERVRNRPSEVWPLLASKINLKEPTIPAVWRHFRFPASLSSDLLDVLVEEERWAATAQKRDPRSRESLASLIDGSVLREALRGPSR